MPPLEIHDPASGARARLLPHAGFNCFDFQVPVAGRMVSVLEAEPGFDAGDKRPSGSGIPLLFPFPNRIRNARFQWEGHEYLLPTKPGREHAIHGFVLDRPWRVTSPDPRTALGTFQLSVDAPDRLPLWPADFILEVRYTVSATTLRADIRVANPSDRPLPWGFGTHPYFHAAFGPDSAADDCQIQLPCSQYWELVDCLPTGKRLPVDSRLDLRNGGELRGRSLDDVLTGTKAHGSEIQTAIIDPKAGIQVSQVTDSCFREWVVYTPPGRPSVCLEPYTCVTDAVNLQQQGIDAGWEILMPGEEFRTWIEIQVGPVLA